MGRCEIGRRGSRGCSPRASRRRAGPIRVHPRTASRSLRRDELSACRHRSQRRRTCARRPASRARPFAACTWTSGGAAGRSPPTARPARTETAGACASYGADLALGEDAARDDAGATAAFARACAAGNRVACVDALQLRPTTTFEEWARACDKGIGEACVEAGLQIAFGAAAATHTPTERAQFFQRACDLGVGNGCLRIAFHYGTGLAVPRDDRHALALMEESCDCHDDTGCSGVGFLLYKSIGVQHDYPRARGIFESLCRRNVGASCSHLGECTARRRRHDGLRQGADPLPEVLRRPHAQPRGCARMRLARPDVP